MEDAPSHLSPKLSLTLFNSLSDNSTSSTSLWIHDRLEFSRNGSKPR